VVAIVADSAANLPGDVVRELGIRIVPMYLKFGDRVYRDGVDMTPAGFYERLASDGVVATSSTPSPADFLHAFREAGDREVVCVTVSAGMSGSFQQASSAAREFSGRAEVVDSGTASMAEGFCAMAAARCAVGGGTLEEAAACAREVGDRASLIATVDTFDYLRRSGRVKKLQAYAATMLDIKPVFRFRGGDVSPVARPRTRRRALARIVDEAVAAIDGRPAHAAVVHAAAREDAEDVRARLDAAAHIVEGLVVEATPVIGAHTGPGLLGVALYTD
jgi:DegV family protein with EDD domain